MRVRQRRSMASAVAGTTVWNWATAVKMSGK
jgi:hypothetical protein